MKPNISHPGRMPAAANARDVPEDVLVVRAGPHDAPAALAIVREYFAAIDLPVAERDDSATLASYLAAPSALWLARRGTEAVGVVARRPLPAIAGACEIKRLFVRQAERGRGIADALLDALEIDAIAAGYTHAYLDSRADLVAAIAFYRRRGYLDCERYSENPSASVFMSRDLRRSPARQGFA